MEEKPKSKSFNPFNTSSSVKVEKEASSLPPSYLPRKGILKRKATWRVLLVVVAVLVIAFSFYKSISNKEQVSKEKPLVMPTQPLVLPTKTIEEINAISEIQTLEVMISDSEIKPQTLNIKVNDQVKFSNNSIKTITIKGIGWGNLPLSAGENMTQPFNEQGSFSYTISGLDYTGQIVVE